MFLQTASGITAAEVSEKTHAIENDMGIVGSRMMPKSTIALDHKWFNHLPAKQLRAQIGEDVWARSTKVTTVRNPFDRIVSAYFWILHFNDQPAPSDPEILQQNVSAFAMNNSFPDDREIFFDGDEYVPDVHIRYETLESDLRTFCVSQGLSETHNALPQTKVLRHKRNGLSTSSFFTPAARDHIRDQYAWLIDRFDYSLENDKVAAH